MKEEIERECKIKNNYLIKIKMSALGEPQEILNYNNMGAHCWHHLFSLSFLKEEENERNLMSSDIFLKISFFLFSSSRKERENRKRF